MGIMEPGRLARHGSREKGICLSILIVLHFLRSWGSTALLDDVGFLQRRCS